LYQWSATAEVFYSAADIGDSQVVADFGCGPFTAIATHGAKMPDCHRQLTSAEERTFSAKIECLGPTWGVVERKGKAVTASNLCFKAAMLLLLWHALGLADGHG
jgi:hypothetical protein